MARKYDPVHNDLPPGWIAAVDLVSGSEKKFASSSRSAIDSVSFSWDDRWDAGPQFSPDGDTAFFISKRDGYDCIWAQPLDPASKRPIGDAHEYQHFHDASQKDLNGYWNGDDSDLSISRNKMIVNLVQWHVNLWMTQIN